MSPSHTDAARALAEQLAALEPVQRVEALNEVRAMLHAVSPLKDHPVDFVRWVSQNDVRANDYNPNTVAPPEMDLLHISIAADGYTQPIVSMLDEDGLREVIDGFHRHRIGKERADVRDSVLGFLPVVEIRDKQKDKTHRMASTIRHNRARGKHRVDAMSDIVVELKRRNWSDAKVAKELGMDADEVLRLTQMAGIAELFADEDFSEAWDIGGDVDANDAVFADEF